ncbi:MAG: hypothetical protein HFJ38_02840 [Bacilli bacterium]|nr:hypothetical protein [Bacilli bacterium]
MKGIKKNLITVLFVIILGLISGKTLYNKISDVYALNVKKEDRIYFLQLGVYKDMESMKYDTNMITDKLVIKEKNNYYVYIGLSKEKENLKKISSLYEKLGYNLYLYEKEVENDTFLTNLEQFDLLMKNAKTEEEIESINAVILSSYEEMILKNK